MSEHRPEEKNTQHVELDGESPFPSGARKTLTDARDRGAWKRHPASTQVPASPAANPQWAWSLRSNNQTNATVRRSDKPTGTLFFGHRTNEFTWVAEPADDTGTGRPAPEPIRITATEAGVLPSFPVDYPWQGNKGQIFSQIGNAVPPRLAAHLLVPHLGKTLSRDDFTLAA